LPVHQPVTLSMGRFVLTERPEGRSRREHVFRDFGLYR
jgi:hypothetical protein